MDKQENLGIYEGVSSTSSHTTAGTIGVEAVDTAYLNQYRIPERYYVNTIVLLPINPESNFLYWELCEDFIRSKYQGEYDGFFVKIMEKSGGSIKEEMSFKVYEESGRYYVNKYLPHRSIFASIGIIGQNGEFIELLKSNVIKTPSDSTSIGDEMWMEKTGEWTEIIKASLGKESDGINSAEFLRELESIKRQHQLRAEFESKGLINIPSSEGFMLGGSENLSSFGLSSSFNVHHNMKKGNL